MIPRFDKNQAADDKTYTWDVVWGQFDDKDSEHDNRSIKGWRVGVLLGDVTDPRNSAKKANGYDEPGLIYTGMKVDEQRDDLTEEIRLAEEDNRVLDPVTVPEIATVNAQRRAAGLPMLDQRTLTRLVQYPNRFVGGGAGVPGVDSHDRQLRLGSAWVDSDWGDRGVRRALRIPVELES